MLPEALSACFAKKARALITSGPHPDFTLLGE